MTKWKILLPLAVLLVGALGFVALVGLRKQPVKEARTTLPPLVRVQEVNGETARLDVTSHGEVAPRRQSDLVAQVGGRVVNVAPDLAAGGFFDEGAVLAEIDPRDYRIAVTQTEARVAQANVRLALEEKEARIAQRDWEALGTGDADPLVLREPQLAEARANLASAEAALERARLDLTRTRIRAPFRGRVRVKNVDVGQFVAPGTPIARVYSTDAAEIRLAIPADQLAYVDLPLSFEDGNDADVQPPVVLRAEFGGRWYEWEGSIVRTEGTIDPSTRVLYAVARVDDPYARGDDPERPPLTVGLFVEAVISGREAPGVFLLPRSAVRNGGHVLIVDDEDRLRFREVGVRRFDGDRAIIDRGLADGETVCVSSLDIAVDGMKVRFARPGAERESGGSPLTATDPIAGNEAESGP